MSAVSHRRILTLALPVMLSNVSTPLLGLVDTAIMGRLPGPQYVGAVALGSLVFSFVFWAFGFLRMGTTGLTAQAVGQENDVEVVANLLRAAGIAVVIGAVLVAMASPIRTIAFRLLDGSTEVERLAQQYYDVRILVAPATLLNFAILGWLVGLGKTGAALVLQLLLNIANIVLDAVFVLVLDWGVVGVARGTAVAEVLAAVAGVFIAVRLIRQRRSAIDWRRVMDRGSLANTLTVNGNIMLRTIALVFVFSFFTDQGARQGDHILAANAILMQLIAMSAYFLDGIAFSTENLVGTALGAKDRPLFLSATRRTTAWAAAFAVTLSAAFLLFGTQMIHALTVDPVTRTTAYRYLPWLVASPILGVWAFQLDGIFIGATRTKEMRNAALVSVGIFLLGWWLLTPFHNHGLWAALMVHYVARVLTMLPYWPAVFPAEPSGSSP